MNSTQPSAAQATLMPAVHDGVKPFGRVKMSVREEREYEDINDWLEMQDDAEVAMLVDQMATRHGRTTRLSAYG